VKYEVLGVRRGPVVSPSAAREMALGAARLLGTDVGIATTGCAGPEPMEDQPVGTLWVGVAVRGEAAAAHALLDGDPATIRDRAVQTALRFAAERIGVFARS
jgi:PncC family amidohydrolase